MTPTVLTYQDKMVQLKYCNVSSAPNEDGGVPTKVATRPLWVIGVAKGLGEDQKGRINSNK